MPVVACLHHLEQPFLGHAEAPLLAAGLELDERSVSSGDPLPSLDDVAGVISFGGAQSAVSLDDPLLQAEAGLLRDAVAREIPVLGICLGGQLLASALGAPVQRARQRTVAWRSLEAVARDALFSGLADPIPALHWNEDVFDLPSGAVEVLGPRNEGVEAFRFGACAWGLQFHPEVDAAALDRWYARYGDWLPEAGVTEGSARALDASWLDVQERVSFRLFAAFGAVVAESARARDSLRVS